MTAYNEHQQAAIDADSRNILCIAGAGTGKTHTMIGRASRILNDAHDPNSLLIVTFTRKAAAEMRERLASQVGERMAGDVMMGTFHSVALRILQDWGHKIGYRSNFTIYDPIDRADILRDIIASMRLNIKKTDLERGLMDMVTEMKEPANSSIKIVIDEYRRRMRAWNALDYDQILLECGRLLWRCEEARRYYQGRFKHIMVDEFQDTNETQVFLIEFLRGSRCSLFAVGDPMQAIYGWRGADVGIIQGFEERYPGAKVVPLTINYRSYAPIIDTANRLACPHGGLRLEAHREGEKALQPEKISIDAEWREGGVVGYFIQQMGQEEFFKDFAVLYRNHSVGKAIAEALKEAGIPHEVVTPDTDIWSADPVRECLARIKVSLNPEDDFSCELACRYDVLTHMADIKLHAIQQNKSFFEIVNAEGWAPLESPITADTPASQALAIAIETVLQRLSSRGLVHQMQCLEFLRERCQEWEGRQSPDATPTIDEWLRYISQRQLADQIHEASNTVKLMTIHAAKGLEWPVVFWAGAEEEIIPGRMNRDGARLDEERRLAYVCITRARDRLIITHAAERAAPWGNHEPRRHSPSRYLEEAGL